MTHTSSLQSSQQHHFPPRGDYLLVFVVLHQALHVPQLPVQFDLVVVDQVHLAPQTRHVGLEQGLHVGSADPLTLQQLQLGLKHLILLLQETHLDEMRRKANMKCFQVPEWNLLIRYFLHLFKLVLKRLFLLFMGVIIFYLIIEPQWIINLKTK